MPDKKELYNTGLDHFGKGEFDEAIKIYEQALKLDPEDGELYMALSMAYQQKNDLDKALSHAQKAVELGPSEPLFYTNLSRIFQKKGMIPEAEDAMAVSRQLTMGI